VWLLRQSTVPSLFSIAVAPAFCWGRRDKLARRHPKPMVESIGADKPSPGCLLLHFVSTNRLFRTAAVTFSSQLLIRHGCFRYSFEFRVGCAPKVDGSMSTLCARLVQRATAKSTQTRPFPLTGCAASGKASQIPPDELGAKPRRSTRVQCATCFPHGSVIRNGEQCVRSVT